MQIKRTAILTSTLCLAFALDARAQAPITKSTSISTTATIQAIDTTARMLTLRDDQGQEETYSVGTVVQRLDELKVGDTVKFTYTESYVLSVLKPGENPAAVSSQTAISRARGTVPGGTLSVQDRMTVTIAAIDRGVPSITVTTPDSRTVTRKVEDPKHLEGLKVGDRVDVVSTRALLTTLERAK